MSIAEQIQRIKTNISNAFREVEKFNVNVTEYNNKSDKLAEAISSITIGETINNQNKTITENGTYTADDGYTGLGEIVVNVAGSESSEVVNPAMINGLNFWMDSQCNTRNGFDPTKPYLENLVAASTSTGSLYTEYWADRTASQFGEDGLLILNTFGRVPAQVTAFNGSKNFTFEAVFKITERISNTTSQLFHAGAAGGFSIGVYPDGGIFAQVYNGKSGTTNTYITFGDPDRDGTSDEVAFFTELGKIYHVCLERNGSECNLYVNNVLIESISCSATAYQGCSTSYRGGIGTKTNNSDAIVTNGYPGVCLGMIRMWSRALTESERATRYQECRKRFNIIDNNDDNDHGSGEIVDRG